MVVVLMGVTGSGKTTVGERLASELGWTFADADDFHPAANKAKMHAVQRREDPTTTDHQKDPKHAITNNTHQAVKRRAFSTLVAGAATRG